jgi:hypothetical protein
MSQMVALTMMALALSEDSIRLRKKRNTIIDALGRLPDHIREVQDSSCCGWAPIRLICFVFARWAAVLGRVRNLCWDVGGFTNLHLCHSLAVVTACIVCTVGTSE